ncbi:hypothetical protein [Nocardioides pakistanensis]
MTDTNPHRDSIDTRVTNLAVKHFGVPKDKTTFTFAREVAALLDVTDEVTRLRAINEGLVRGHNGLLVALARTEEDARSRIDEYEQAADAARLPGNAVTLVRAAAAQVEAALDSLEAFAPIAIEREGHADAATALSEARDFLTSALDVVAAQTIRAKG